MDASRRLIICSVIAPCNKLKLKLYVDRISVYHYSRLMRWQAVIVLIALAFTIALPPSFTASGGSDEQPVLGSLDVCHSATPALASSGGMPCMFECPCNPVPAPSIVYSEQTNSVITDTLLISRNERPPQS